MKDILKALRWGTRKTVVGLAVLGLLVVNSTADPQPADKVMAVASDVEVMQSQSLIGSSSAEVTLLHGTMRTSTPADLMISVTAETGLYTAVTTVFTNESEARAKVLVWVEIDGLRVPVSFDSNGDGVFDDPDDGRVVFNNRDFGLSSINLLAVLTAFEKTRSANAFNWIALNVGPGVHSIVVKGRLETIALSAATSAAAVGKRTMIAEPSKLANDVTI